MFQQTIICYICNGSGKIIQNKCHNCSGEGIIPKQEYLGIEIPKGVEEGMQLNMPGYGNCGKNNGPNGDLLILIEEEKLVHLIAGNILGARQIEGFLTRLGSESKIKNLPITEDLITSTLGKGEHEIDRSKNTNPEIMIEAVCKHYSIGRRAILGKGRSKFIARSRQVLMYLIRTELNLSLEEVGRLVGGRDHSTVIHGVDKITKLASENVQIREDILRIKSVI